MAGSITSTGLGSGLDIEKLVTQLVAVEGQPARQRLDQRETQLQARISAFATLKSAVSSLQSSLASLTDISGYQSVSASSSDKDIATVSATNAAAISDYDLDVSQLAQAQRLVTDPAAGAGYTALTDTVGTGSLTFSFGTVDYDSGTDAVNGFVKNPDRADQTVTITDGSLTGIRDAVNAADIGVQASIIYDGTNYRLSFASEDTGAANAMQISVVDDDGNNADSAGLSQLNFNQTTNFMLQNQAGLNASATLNGIAITSETNTLNETVDGLTINLLAAGTATLKVASDPASITKNVEGFVNSFNNLRKTINGLGSFNADTKQAGVLNGDATLRMLESRLNRLIGTPISGADSNYQILAQVGITRNSSNGSLELDKTKLEAAIEDDPEAVTALFAAFGRPTDTKVEFTGSDADTRTGEYAVNITQLATQGQLTGTQAANLTITSGSNDVLSVEVDGVAVSVTLDAGTYTAAELATQVQSKLNSTEDFQNNDVQVAVSEAGGVLSITSERYGSASKVAVTGGNGADGLFGASPTSTDGLDVAGTIGGVGATGSGQTLTGTGNAEGLTLRITGTGTGDRGTVNFTRGYAAQLESYLGAILDNDTGSFDPLTEDLQDRLSEIEDDRRDLARRLDNLEARLRAEFNAMDQLVGQLQATGDFLTRQLASIPVIGANRNN